MENETNVAPSLESPKAAVSNTEKSMDALLHSYTLPSQVLLSSARDRILCHLGLCSHSSVWIHSMAAQPTAL